MLSHKTRSAMLLHHGWRELDALNWLRTNKFNFYFFKVFSPWLEKMLNFQALWWLTTNNFKYYFPMIPSPRLKKFMVCHAFRTNIFNLYFLELRNGLEQTISTSIFSKYPQYGWKKKLNSNALKRLTTKKFYFPKRQSIFTMVQENFKY